MERTGGCRATDSTSSTDYKAKDRGVCILKKHERGISTSCWWKSGIVSRGLKEPERFLFGPARRTLPMVWGPIGTRHKETSRAA